jgi:hypothetical protein
MPPPHLPPSFLSISGCWPLLGLAMMLKLTVGPKDPMRAGVEGWKLLL